MAIFKINSFNRGSLKSESGYDIVRRTDSQDKIVCFSFLKLYFRG